VGAALEVVRRQYEAFQRQDWDALFAEVRAGDVFTVRDGLIVHFANFLDREDARSEIGLG
jgi:ketosteroid isomerase-like protein